MKLVVLFLLLTPLGLLSQTPAPTTTTTPTCAKLNYNYFAESGITYASVSSVTTGFGLRIGCSNVFFVTDIDSTIGAPLSSYSTLRVGGEYVVAVQGYWSLVARAALGATTSPTVSFAGGGGIQYDIGSQLTKGKFPLLLDAQISITAIPGSTTNQVSKGLGILLRKTF